MSAGPVEAKVTGSPAASAAAVLVPARRTRALAPSNGSRPWTFYALATLFTFYVLALYGPMICIYVLSFQDVRGGLVFPVRGFPSLYWFNELFEQTRTGDVKGAFDRSIKLAILVTVLTVVISFLAGLAFRRRFWGRLRNLRHDDRQPCGARPRPWHRDRTDF